VYNDTPFYGPLIVSESSQQTLSNPIVPTSDSVVQADITGVGEQAHIAPAPTSRSAQTLPDQTPVAMLSRLRFITEFSWSTLSNGVLYLGDIEYLLRTNTELAPLLAQYEYYRANFKVFIRINSNQFYSGALMISHWPVHLPHGQFRNQRAVLNPVTISASTQQSATIEIAYGYNTEWLYTHQPPNGENQSMHLVVEVLAPLVKGSDTLSDTITVQLFAAYVDPLLQFNKEDIPVPQSKTEIVKDKKGTNIKSTLASTPAKDANTRGNGTVPSFKEMAPTIASVPILGDIVGSLFDVLRLGTNAVSSLVPTVTALAPLAPLLLDKPEVATDPVRAYGSVGIDNFASDVGSVSVPVTYSKNNYGAMLTGLGVSLGTWSIAQYASLPGIAGEYHVTNLAPSGIIPIRFTPTPLGRTCAMFAKWKGSVRVRLQIFASMFTSTRLALYLTPYGTGSAVYDDHIVRIAEVKGDTVIDFTIPFICPSAWYEFSTLLPWSLCYRTISPIVGNDLALDPSIHMVAWVAAGPDAQFALEIKPDTWFLPEVSPLPEAVVLETSTPLPASKVRRLLKPPPPKLPVGPAKPQSSISEAFYGKTFTPIVDGCSYVVDEKYGVSDVPVTYNDLLKRYMFGNALTSDSQPFYSSTDIVNFRHTTHLNNFGVIRGGLCLKARVANPAEPGGIGGLMALETVTGVNIHATTMASASDHGFHTLSFPWVHGKPFIFRLSSETLDRMQMSQYETYFGTPLYAFRDDVELGLPVLPLTNS